MNNVVVLDMDGVIADFDGYFCEEFGYDHRHYIPLEKRYPKMKKEIHEFVHDPFTYAFLKPLPTGVMTARWLRRNGYAIHIVSARPATPDFFRVTGGWLSHYGVPYDYMSLGRDKKERIIKKAPVLVMDDFFDICYMWSVRYLRRSILVEWPWNETLKLEKSHPRNGFLLRVYPYHMDVDLLMKSFLSDINV